MLPERMDEHLPDTLLRYRRPLVVLVHLCIWTLAYSLAFVIRFDTLIPDHYFELQYVLWIVPLLLARLAAYQYYGLYQGMWRYTGHRDLVDLAKATSVSSAVFALLVLSARLYPYPRSVILVDFMLTIAMVGGIRFASRTLFEATSRVTRQGNRRMLIIGAADSGEVILREVLRNMSSVVTPVGFLDDDPNKRGMQIHGLRVLGTVEDAPALIRELNVTEVVIATPNATGSQMRRILEHVTHGGVHVRTMPSLHQLVDGQVTINQLREVKIEDLLGRAPVSLDGDAIGRVLRNDVALVTGAGGSIGSELCRQICAFSPSRLVLVERSENSLYEIHRELSRAFPDIDIVPRIADICDRDRLDAVFGEFKPVIVLHAAAHKHVPMMEWNAAEALKNNIGGTRNVADLAHAHKVRRFVMISTDKAVNPTSVMGCTKRVAELYVQAQAQRSETRFLTVRFGNVLGSNGSVIPLFTEQIARGGPVTVTHPEMQRYFMTIPEAAQLVLQAASMASSGDVCVLDMGEPVKIVTLAEDLIRMSGLEPGVDIEIHYVGMRPGEKLFEELSVTDENAERTDHPKIFTGRGEPRSWAEITSQVDRLLENAEGSSAEQVRAALKRVVPEYAHPGAQTPPAPGNVIPLRSNSLE